MEDDVIKISEKLVAIYINMAEEQELSNTREDLEMALDNYRKCLEFRTATFHHASQLLNDVGCQESR